MNSNQAKYLLKCASGLHKSAVFNLPQAAKWWDSPEAKALMGAAGGGIFGTGAGYLLSDEDKKKRGMIAGGLAGAGIGGGVGLGMGAVDESRGYDTDLANAMANLSDLQFETDSDQNSALMRLIELYKSR